MVLTLDNARAWCNRANTLDDIGRSIDALANYERALSLEPDFSLALNNRGNTLMKLGQHEAALASFERALTMIPIALWHSPISEMHCNVCVVFRRV